MSCKRHYILNGFLRYKVIKKLQYADKQKQCRRNRQICSIPFLRTAYFNHISSNRRLLIFIEYSEAQLDRFLFKIDVPFPNKDELHEVLRRTTAGESPKVSAVMSKQDILTLRALAAEVPIAEHVQDYALKIVLGTHPEMDTCSERVKKYVRFGSSPRGAQAIIKAAKIHAIFDGRFNVSNDDIRFAAVPALRHRTILNFEGVAENISTDDILADLIKHTRETAQK